MKVVKVYGALKERLGGQGTFELDVFSAAEAIKALCANFVGLDKWFFDSGNDGIGFQVLLGKTEVGEDNCENLLYPWSEKEVFHITPVVTGAIKIGRAFRRFITGAIIVGLAMWTGGISLGFSSTTFLTTAGTWATAKWYIKAAILLGTSLMLSGISEMLTPVPQAPPEARKLQSFSFSGIQQTSSQGGAVPIVYGKCFVGSSVLSVGLDTDNV